MQTTGIGRQQGQKIASLQALRAWAFLGVFFEHAKFFIAWPTLGVSIFFVMSGFLMAARYENVDLAASPKDCFLFSWKKILKLYPLHILTMLCAAVFPLWSIIRDGFSIGPAVDLAENLLLHITLLQTWVPDCTIAVSLNGVSWYLSVTVFLYFVFPWLKRVVERGSLARLCLLCVLLLACETLACVLALRAWGNRSPGYIWFMYNFPIFRVGDFFVGCVLKRAFFESGVKRLGTIQTTILEVLATALTVLVYFWCASSHSNIVLQALNNWTTPFIPMAAVWVLLFAANKGLLTRALTNRVTVAVGNISAFAYLIHNIVVMAAPHLISRMRLPAGGLGTVLVVSAELAVSIALSVCYKRLDEKYISKLVPAGSGRPTR